MQSFNLANSDFASNVPHGNGMRECRVCSALPTPVGRIVCELVLDKKCHLAERSKRVYKLSFAYLAKIRGFHNDGSTSTALAPEGFLPSGSRYTSRSKRVDSPLRAIIRNITGLPSGNKLPEYVIYRRMKRCDNYRADLVTSNN